MVGVTPMFILAAGIEAESPQPEWDVCWERGLAANSPVPPRQPPNILPSLFKLI
jgi:hypothetical protein